MTLFSLQLKPLSSEQLPQLVELDQLCLGGLWSLDGYQRELDSPNSIFVTLSCPRIFNKILAFGCFWAILEEAHITLLVVHPDYQGQGFGQLLLHSLLTEALNRKLERATLEVRDSNHIALSLYNKFGFKVAGRRKGYYKATGEDALILWRSGLQFPEFTQELAIIKEKIIIILEKNHWKL